MRMEELSKRLIRIGWDSTSGVDVSSGRRLRVFASSIVANDDRLVPRIGGLTMISASIRIDLDQLTFGDAYLRCRDGVTPEWAGLRNALAEQPMRVGRVEALYSQGERAPEYQAARDPDLPASLQDLGDEINEDVREACEALRDPDLYYPGVDEGIDPVPDEHVELVVWALQRELKRELRPSENVAVGGSSLPSAPLTKLPWNVQRALAERRRLRYRQWGITREVWRSGVWNLWEVPEDPEWVPRRQLRLVAEGRSANGIGRNASAQGGLGGLVFTRSSIFDYLG